MVNRPDGCTCTYLDSIHADTCNLIDGHSIGTPPMTTHDDGRRPHPRGLYPAQDAFYDHWEEAIRHLPPRNTALQKKLSTPVTPADANAPGSFVVLDNGQSTEPTPTEATAYTDGLRRAFAEALDALRTLPTAVELEAAVVIRERAHQWDIDL